jgi:hypothetical protein
VRLTVLGCSGTFPWLDPTGILAEAAGAFAGPVELAWADASYDIGEP